MKGEAHLTAVICKVCSESFHPKPMGYNARYCSRSCKDKTQRQKHPERFKRARKRSYARIVLDR